MGKRNRLLLYSPGYAEYSARLAKALSAHADVLLILDAKTRKILCEDEWFKATTAGVRVLEFIGHSLIWRALSMPILTIVSLLFRPKIFHIQEQADFASAWMTRILG